MPVKKSLMKENVELKKIIDELMIKNNELTEKNKDLKEHIKDLLEFINEMD